MHRYTSFPPSSVNAEEVFHDTSTAPTTPDGSLTFSPVLQALKLHDALEVVTLASPGKLRKESTNLTVRAGAGVGKVEKICCIGAGYVGVLRLSFRPLVPISKSRFFFLLLADGKPKGGRTKS